jgi:2',3'-cyclic-nucleotide 2'-phosphodiesterase/3'-nucleotidase
MAPCLDFSEALDTLRQHTVSVHLRLLATSDLHAHLLPFDYYHCRSSPGLGLVALAGLIETARGSARNCLLVDNGDTLQGSPMADLAASDLMAFGGRHPMIEAMNALGYDAMTLGNHDFDYGPDFLDAALDGAGFPVVLANAVRRQSDAPYRAGGVILERAVTDQDGGRHTLRIGLTGTVPPQVARWNRTALGGKLRFTDAVEAARRQVAELRGRGADLVIVLSHSGLGKADPPLRPDPLGEENVALAIAGLPGVDLVVAGHTHEVHPAEGAQDGRGRRAPVVQPGALGSHLGCIDLALVREMRTAPRLAPKGRPAPPRSSDAPDPDAGPWRMTRALARALPQAETAPSGRGPLRKVLRSHPELRRRLGAQHRATRAFTDRELGATAVPLTTYFSTLAPCAATQLVADTQRIAARAVLEGQDDLTRLPLLSAVAPMRCGGRGGPEFYTDVAPGPLLLRHVADLYIYHNALAVLRMRGRDVIGWLERAASIYRRIDPDCEDAQYLIDHAFAGYNFDRIDGLDYEIDVSAPARTNAEGDAILETEGRVKNVRLADGRALHPDEEVLVVTNTYRAAGGGHFPMCEQAATVGIDTTPVRELIVERIRTMNGAAAPRLRPNFSLTGFGTARLLYGTGPGALAHEDTWSGLGLTPEGIGPTGFQYFELAS